ncbi:MAG: ABC transporter permease [Anaerolineales bacterium]|nr:ABC transporter permease [Anaerolineales bacterium]
MNTRIFLTEVRDELLSIFREPIALFFSVLVPVAFFALFATMFGGEGGFGVESVARYGAFGVLSVVLSNPGISLADAIERGWLRVKRADGTPLGVTLSAKVTAALPYAIITLAGITLVARLTAGPLDTIQVLRVIGVLLLGSLPFSLFSLAVGAKFSTNSATAVLNAVLIPSVILSGLWFPLEMLPAWLGNIAVYLPPYHLAQLALAQVEGGAVWGHLAYLAGTTIVGAITAALAYRSAEV